MEADNILENISSSALKLLAPLTLEEVYKITLEEAIKLVNCEDGMIVREVDGELKTVFGSTKAAAAYKVRKRGNSYKALREDKAIIMHNSDISEAFPNKNRVIHSVIFIPLSYKGKPEGVLILRSKRDKKFTEKELNILKVFGAMASLAMKKNELYDETKQALETRDMFIAIASHELRTPLTSLNGYVQLLHSRLSKTDSVEAKWVQSLYDETTRLTNLIKELLEINRIKQGTLQFVLRESQLTDIIEKAIDRTKFLYKTREIILQNKLKSKESTIIADSEKMLQVLSALLKNAVKFSPEKSPVIVSLSKKSGEYIVHIQDKGKGMGREDIRRIFHGFYKNSENLQSGMGVGLMLAKHIINYHHGSIQVLSEVNKGTTVEIKLPEMKV